ncbi:hypothetical protein K505DRAFT_301175 [Melanomma pulvis-pyrius CBS 109.77]|uniref:Zn(2)-C6 fungal-type domain-containing protein n=1 Tax=Melanomma pulvis-pyrius CBS 109.77 TaxID=1314802 RepID=A0A6A6XIQ6_9PLEO|nr:hypothetical protein K505DRAFT_301175 [Melanomma pulvis-pyrius CBS 109.77]
MSAVSDPGSEKNANPSSTPAPIPKLRSCVVCRRRKVRCDKQSPCSNCRRANIACVLPSADRPPKWARRHDLFANNASVSKAPAAPEHAGPDVAKVIDRLRTLEALVKELSGQLEEARAATHSTDGGSSGVDSPESSTQDTGVHKQFGRLVLQDANRSRYVSSGFWSRVNDELDGLKMDTRVLAGAETNSSEDEASPPKTPPTQELQRTPSERHAFLFRHNLSPSTPDLREFHPLPSQIPFLLDIFSENVNAIIQIVHIPTVSKLVRDLRGSGMTRLTPANEALMFSIYYAAITSMEEDDVMANFGSSKSNLNLKYRLGLEYALAKADFLDAPDIVLVQAFAIFIGLVRRHDSPRFVWMITGLVIRMAQYLGLQRDGSHFEHLTPFEIEMRRKVWWVVYMLDVRASEDQGTDLTIASGSFDTKIPLNINDVDISPESEQMPLERDSVTDMSFARIFFGVDDIVRQMMAPGAKDDAKDLQEQTRLLNELYQKFEQGYMPYETESGNISYWIVVTIARLVMAKMTLIVYLPILFSSPSEHFSDEIRNKLLVSAIEVAEYNHALNAEQAGRKWRWIYQTYTHWHAIVYLMIDISRRPWSPIVERAWVALHSSWLIPAQNPLGKNLRIWVPLRKLMAKARRHRNAELSRLRADPQAAIMLKMEDQEIPLPSSSEPFPIGSNVGSFRDRWCHLVGIPEGHGGDIKISEVSGAGLVDSSMETTHTSQPTAEPISAYDPSDLSANSAFGPMYFDAIGQQVDQNLASANIRDEEVSVRAKTHSDSGLGQPIASSYNSFPTIPTDSLDGRTMGLGSVPWLWADVDPSVDVFSNVDVDFVDTNMDLDSDINWYNWVESAKGMETTAGQSNNDWL